MLIPNIYLIIAGQVAIIMVFLIAYLIYMLVSEENRWEAYTDKLKDKIRELQEYKDRFDVVSENLHKQMAITKELTEKVEQFDSQLEAKDNKITEQENFIVKLQSTISDLQDIIKGLEEKEKQLDESNLIITELKTQLALLEDQATEHPEQINNLNSTIEDLETENTSLKTELTTASETIVQYDQQFSDAKNDDFNLTIEGKPKQSNEQLDLINNVQGRYKEEIERLKKNYKNQKNIIDDLEMALMSAKKDPSKAIDFDDNVIDKFKQMLSESNTVIEMLEGEIDTLQAEINQLMTQNEALSNANNPTQTTDSETTPDDILEENNEDAFFEDTPEENTPDEISNENSDDIFFDVDSEPADVFFDNDPPPETTQATNNESIDNAELEQLQSQIDSANQMAMSMMMISGDQGNIINFARNSIQYETLQDLGKGVLETVALFQVSGALQIRGEENEHFNLSSYGELSQSHIDKISDITSTERFDIDGPELLIRYQYISLLIKDMPLDDADKVGRIQDNMAIALELACATSRSIEASIKIKKNQKILNNVIKNTYETIQNVEKQFNEQNEITNQVVNSLTGIISNPAMTEGMDPIYKDVFTSIINDGKSKFDKIKESGIAIDDNFADIVKRLGAKINE